MPILYRAFVTAVIALNCPVAGATDCGLIAKWLDLCTLAREAGKEAAIEVSKGMVNSTDIAFSAINFWPWLIQKYHTGNPEEQAKARQLVSKVFGVEEIEGVKPFEITFQFEGVDTTTNKLDFVLLRDYTQPDLKLKIYNGNTADFNILALKGIAPANQSTYEPYVTDVAIVRNKVAQLANEAVMTGQLSYTGFRPITSSPSDAKLVCTDPSNAGGEVTYTIPSGSFIAGGTFKCKDNATWKLANSALNKLTEAIMITVDPKVDKLANRLKTSFAYEGHKYLTLLFPVEQLEQQPNLRVLFSIHLKGQSDRTIPIFSGNLWSVSQATIRDPKAIFESKRKEHQGRYYAYLIDLGV